MSRVPASVVGVATTDRRLAEAPLNARLIGSTAWFEGWRTENLEQASRKALNFAKHRFGVALVPTMMAADDVATGRIVQMDFDPLELTGLSFGASQKDQIESRGSDGSQCVTRHSRYWIW